MDAFLFRLRSFDFSTQVGVAIILGVTIGLISLFMPPLTTLFIVLGIPVCLIAIRHPELSVLAVLVMLCTVIPDTSIPMVELGTGQVYLSDIIMVAMVALIIIRWLVDKKFKLARTPLDLPIFLFVFWAILVTALAYFQKTVDIRSAIPEVRAITYYLMFFVVANLIIEKRSMTVFVNGFFLLATVVAAMMVAQYILGNRMTIIPGRVETLVTDGRSYAEVTRIADTVGEGLITVAFITKTAVLFIRKLKLRRVADIVQWGLLGVALILTFSRTHWFVTGLAMIMAFFLIPQEDRIKLVRWVLILFFLLPIIVVPVLVSPNSLAAQLFIAAGQRIATLNPQSMFNPDPTNTLRWRDFEYKYGLPQIAAHPVMGLGLGALYRPEVYSIDDADKNMQYYTHNSHLWVAMKTGLVGYIFLLWISFLFVWRGFRRWSHISDPQMSGVVLGFTLTFVGAFFVAALHPIFVTLYWTPLLGVMFGVNEAIYRIYKPEETPLPPPQEINPNLD